MQQSDANRNNGVALSFEEVLRLPWSQNYMMGILAVDWVMYNPNYSMYLYCNLEFTYRANGKIVGNLMLEGFRIKYDLWTYLWYTAFLIMFIYLAM